ncbi:Eco57I restriction-modification methylase domain-containing protein [Brevibacterium picturae]|uniref:site-specific DNA-methyltransferase (adenine-specific) n=1 Tax=Brevibacterium picturae TaxID=260553 RepID=A0ABN2CLT8_9MICO
MDELTVVQDFVSDDYFTSDAPKESFKSKALQLRKEWENTDSVTPLSEWASARTRLQKQLLSLDDAGDSLDEDTRSVILDFDRSLLDFLGYTNGYEVTPGQNADGTESSYLEVRGLATSDDSSPLLIVFATPVDDVVDLLDKDAPTLLTPVVQHVETGSERLEITESVAKYLSKRFVEDTPPGLALVLAGPTMLLTGAEKWQEGRYLAIDLGLLFERNDTKRGGAVDRFLAATTARALAPSTDGTTWFSEVFEDSVKHTEKVSEDLREAVQTSIELIANDVVTRRRVKNLPPLPEAEAQVLAKQSLRFLYRILFLLFAEASPELEVVPTGATEYESGYSLDRLRDLALVDIPTKGVGTHLYDSLHVLFTQIQNGHNDLRLAEATPTTDDTTRMSEGLVFHPLEADVFSTAATSHIDEVGLSNTTLQAVLKLLLWSKEKPGKDLGAISYSELGINQLGRVYEALMSYTGFFAEADLFEVAPKGDASKGSWVIETDRAEHIAAEDFKRELDERTGEMTPVIHRRGSFVFRLSGRDRQQSASYYTPDVLTQFTVSQALAELLTENTTADEVLALTVCEPALGSGAFALEAVNQLSAEYLRRKQNEVETRIDPADYPQELQKTKAYIALHNVYGVDLNATAVELAEISLWLDTMVTGLSAPWFGLRLRRGNSLIGARRSVYSRTTVKDKTWLKSTPVKTTAEDRDPQSIYQFLLPAEGWGAAADAKEGRALAPEAVAALKNWRKTMRVKLSDTKTNPRVSRAVALSKQVDTLWAIALKRLEIAEAETHRSIGVWGQAEPSQGTTVTRKQIEDKLADPNGAYQRLRRVMDAWCALWFWPLTETDITPPNIDDWIDACEQLLGKPVEESKKQQVVGQGSILDAMSWGGLNDFEDNQRIYSRAAKNVETVLEAHPWLAVTERIAAEQGFFHWELDFATIFDRGGFNLQLGNPPWVRPDWNEADILGDFDVAFALETKMPVPRWNRLKDEALESKDSRATYVEQASFNSGNRTFLGHVSNYPIIAGLRTDLYRCFMEQTWDHMADSGVVSLIHPETHFTDDKAQTLRRETYLRLRRHWQFINELQLFEVHHLVSYGVHVYARRGRSPRFLTAASLYHPDTVEKSFMHNGDGEEPGLKTAEGQWDLRPHSSRILTIGHEQLESWKIALGNTEHAVLETPMIYAVNTSSAHVMEKLAESKRIFGLSPMFSQGWNETTDFKNGRFLTKWGAPESWDDVILQGPHFHVGVPFYKQPNSTMKNNLDWSEVDREGLEADAVPVTSYKPIRDGKYDQLYTHWDLPNGDRVAARDYFRVAWRAMAANTGERTLIPAIIPPGTAHINGVFSYGFEMNTDLVLATAAMSSLLADFGVRVAPKSGIYPAVTARLPLPDPNHPLAPDLAARVLLLNSVTSVYTDLWNSLPDLDATDQAWTNGYGYPDTVSMDVLDDEWSADSPLRLAADRRQAQVEIDALVALMLGVTADELCSIYRTQFPVLYKYDTQRDHYDQNGRLVPAEVLKAWQKLGDSAGEDELSATNAQGFTYTYAPPFATLDREADMRAAYAEFEQRLAHRTSEAAS